MRILRIRISTTAKANADLLQDPDPRRKKDPPKKLWLDTSNISCFERLDVLSGEFCYFCRIESRPNLNQDPIQILIRNTAKT